MATFTSIQNKIKEISKKYLILIALRLFLLIVTFSDFFSAILGKESSDDYIKMANESRPPDLRGLENNIVELDIEDSPEHP